MHDRYRMNPGEDEILFGHELADGMLVLSESWTMRSPHGYDEEDLRRKEVFRKVTRLRRPGHLIVFIGEWPDGYQEVHTYASDYAWLVKRATLSTETKDGAMDESEGDLREEALPR